MSSFMYRENAKSLNPFVGCHHGCVYCKPSFQLLAKRMKCEQCKKFEPHFHPKRLDKTPPKTKEDEFIFFPSMGDIAFASSEYFDRMLSYAGKYPDRSFLIQSKNPACFEGHKFTDNVILGITLETDKRIYHTPSLYTTYVRISKAPTPIFRFVDFKGLKHTHKIVTIEPILDFSETLKKWIFQIDPETVYIGYDNHRCGLPEPRLEKTLELIDALEKFTEVREKTIRKAWWE